MEVNYAGNEEETGSFRDAKDGHLWHNNTFGKRMDCCLMDCFAGLLISVLKGFLITAVWSWMTKG